MPSASQEALRVCCLPRGRAGANGVQLPEHPRTPAWSSLGAWGTALGAMGMVPGEAHRCLEAQPPATAWLHHPHSKGPGASRTAAEGEEESP